MKTLDSFPERALRRDSGYNTNLAAEFFVLSLLHRLGLTANLTLGNKKSVDIVVVLDRGRAITIDVKGLAGMTSWPRGTDFGHANCPRRRISRMCHRQRAVGSCLLDECAKKVQSSVMLGRRL